jgi:hypothetical protein
VTVLADDDVVVNRDREPNGGSQWCSPNRYLHEDGCDRRQIAEHLLRAALRLPRVFVRRFCCFTQCRFVGRDELDVTHTERLREVVERHHGRIAPATLEATHILLCES